jgi:tetratricopeptide (TPR) repeat protein
MWKSILRAAMVGLGTVAFMSVMGAVGCTQGVACKEEARHAEKSNDWRNAEKVCRQEYAATDDPNAGFQFVRALVRNGDFGTATTIGQAVAARLNTFDAYHVLADAANRAEQFSLSEEASLKALALSVKDGSLFDYGSALLRLGVALLSLDQLQAAQINLDQARQTFELLSKTAALDPRKASGGKDRLLSVYLLEVDVLYKKRRLFEAEEKLIEIERATGGVFERFSYYLIWRELKLGIVTGAKKEPLESARAALEQALVFIERSGTVNKDVKQAVYLNLAFVAREEARAEQQNGGLSSPTVQALYREALDHLQKAEDFEATAYDLNLQRGIVLFHLEQFSDAEVALERALETTRESILQEANYYLGRVKEAQGDVNGALGAYSTACQSVNRLLENAGEYSEQVAAEHCLPFFRRAGLHITRGEPEKALAALIEQDWYYTIPEKQKKWKANKLGPGDPPAPEVLLQRWKGRHLLILVSDTQTIWRLEVRDQQLIGCDLGAAAGLEALASRLVSDPDDAEAARLLGEKILPRVEEGTGALEILTLGTMEDLPLAALRRDKALVIERTPLARVLSLRSPPVQPEPRGSAVVLGDLGESLTAAKEEAELVAARLGVAPLLNRSATRDKLFSADGAPLLYVAAHIDPSELLGPHLRFGTEVVNAREIRDKKLAPKIVVLSSCIGADAHDVAKRDSLAAAFLESGSRAVIAASRTVGDKVTLELMRNLDLKLLQTDPVRALAAAQLAAKDTMPIADWSAFSVLLSPPAQ